MKLYLSHAVRREYFVHFRKCFDKFCNHCQNTIHNVEPLKLLKELDRYNLTIPRPVIIPNLYQEEHYPSLIDYIQSQELKENFQKEIRKSELLKEKCRFCDWWYCSDADKQKHKIICK